jgi:hypothetical protein
MKRYYAAASALLLSTSALAWSGSTNKDSVGPAAASGDGTELTWDKTTTGTEKPVLAADTGLTTTKDSKLEFASLDKDLEQLSVAETDAKVQAAALNGWDGAKVQTASFDDSKLDTALTDGDAKVETAWVDTGADAKIETASTDDLDSTGMGGPLEEVAPASGAVVEPSNANPEHDARGIAVISDPAFVPPGYNGMGGAMGGPIEGGDNESYPACTATVTDNCVQTYERGVDASLASSASKVDSDSTAMGGPWQPVYAESELAMNGDGEIDVAKGEMIDSETELAVETDTAIATHSDYQGVGGPVEAQSGYPPCSPGPGDDRCIQLYEPGVTGAGN